MDYRFLDRFSIGKGKLNEQRLENSVASRINSFSRRHTDRETLTKIGVFLWRKHRHALPSVRLSTCHMSAKTVNRVLMEALQPKAAGL